MGIAVTDESGALIAYEKMDGASSPTHGLASALGGRMLVLSGGLPIIVDDVVVGGIGVSSGSPTQDLEVAQAGLEAFLNS